MDTSSNFFNGFYRFGEIILLLIYVNLLWFFFTILGLVIFGIGPSTVAMFTIFREWSMGKTDSKIFQTFWKTFRTEFVKSNGLTLILIVIGYMLYVNLNYIEFQSDWMQIINKYVLLVTSVIYGLMLIYIFPIYVHYENKFFSYFKNAAIITIYHPIRTIYMLAACLTLYYLFATLPVFIFMLGASLSSMVIMWITYRTFIRIEYKQAMLLEDQA